MAAGADVAMALLTDNLALTRNQLATDRFHDGPFCDFATLPKRLADKETVKSAMRAPFPDAEKCGWVVGVHSPNFVV